MSILAIDVESFLIERARPLPPVVCLSYATMRPELASPLKAGVMPHTAVEEFMGARLASTEERFVGHSIAYDFGTLAASYPDLLLAIFDAYKAGRVTDTQIRQQLIDIASGRVMSDDKVRGYALAGLYEACFDEKIPGPGGSKGSILETPTHARHDFGRLYNVDFAEWSDDHIEYSRQDSIATLRVHDLQQEKAGDKLRDDPFQAYSAFVLSLISAKGMRTDPGRVAALKARKQAEAKALEPEMVAEGMLEPRYALVRDGGHQIGWIKKDKPPRERIARVCEVKGIKPYLTDTGVKLQREGKPTGIEHIAIDRTACVWADDPLMLRRADYVSACKILDTYIPVLEQGYEYPITSRYNLAATGRTTSSAPSLPIIGTNLQNAPRAPGVRECYVPRDGKILMLGDFWGAEMHTLAQVCLRRVGYSVLGDTLKAGRCAHVNTARYLLGGASTPLDYDDARARYKQGDPEVKQARQNAKAVNFGFGGYMHADTFVKTQLKEGQRWTVHDAKVAREAWLVAYPEMPEYFAGCKSELGPGGECTVELHWSKRLRKVRGVPTIANSFFQALAADGAKKAINEVVRVCMVAEKSWMRVNNTYGVNFVHDELICETDDSGIATLQVVAAEFKGIMEREFNELVPDYPTKVDVVFARYWSKAAEQVFDSEGRLGIWNG